MVRRLRVIALNLVVWWGVYERSRFLGEWDTWTASLGRRTASSAAVGHSLQSGCTHPISTRSAINGTSIHRFILLASTVGSGVRVLALRRPSSASRRVHPSCSSTSTQLPSYPTLSPSVETVPCPSSLHTCPTAAHRVVRTNGTAPVPHPRLFRAVCGMRKAHGYQHNLPRGAAPMAQRHFLLRLAHRRVAHHCPRVAHPCGSPGATRPPACACHLQVRQRHRLAVLCPSARAHSGLRRLAPRISRLVRRIPVSRIHLPTVGAHYTCLDQRTPYHRRHCDLGVPLYPTHLSSERTSANAGHKTEVRALGLAWHALCHSLSARSHTDLIRGATGRADNPRIRERHAALAASTRGLSERAFCQSRGRTCTSTTGLASETGQGQGPAEMTADTRRLS